MPDLLGAGYTSMQASIYSLSQLLESHEQRPDGGVRGARQFSWSEELVTGRPRSSRAEASSQLSAWGFSNGTMTHCSVR